MNAAKHFTTAIVNEGGDTRITCDDCAETKCAICGHEPCPMCIDDCDHPECIVWEGRGHSSLTHRCKFTPCEKHRPDGAPVSPKGSRLRRERNEDVNCYQCGEPIVGPDNEDAHDNREKCIRNLRSQLSAARESAEKAEADAAALRNVLEDCHAHDLYVGDGAEASRLYRKSHGADFGREKDESAHDHDVSMRAAVAGQLGGQMLDELRALRKSVHVPGEMCPTYLAAKGEWERELDAKHAQLVDVADKLRGERERWEASRQALLVAYDRWDRGGVNVDEILTVVRGIISRAMLSPQRSGTNEKE
jgi:hypothetical protein